jgi:FlaA1/EpsC-like NDP-sugar epimerase
MTFLSLLGFVTLNRSLVLNDHYHISFSIITINFLLSTNLLIAARFIYQSIYHYSVHQTSLVKRTLIYGTGESGQIAYQVLNKLNKSEKKVVGFIDDSKIKGRTIDGLKVFNESSLSKRFLSDLHISNIVIAINSISSDRLIEITDSLSTMNVEINIVPEPNKWINGGFEENQIQPVKIEDLLGRRTIELENIKLKNEIQGKVILVTGAAGSIGSEISLKSTT